MATSEDVSLATRWLLERMERDQDERREWNREAMDRNEQENMRHARRVNRIWICALLRPLVELAILITLLVKF